MPCDFFLFSLFYFSPSSTQLSSKLPIQKGSESFETEKFKGLLCSLALIWWVSVPSHWCLIATASPPPRSRAQNSPVQAVSQAEAHTYCSLGPSSSFELWHGEALITGIDLYFFIHFETLIIGWLSFYQIQFLFIHLVANYSLPIIHLLCTRAGNIMEDKTKSLAPYSLWSNDGCRY